MKKSIKCIQLLLLLLLLFNCKTNIEQEIQKEVDKQEFSDDKTYLQIKNNSQFTVNVYVSLTPSQSKPSMTIKAGESKKEEISASETIAGDAIYIQYLHSINGIEISYFDFNDPNCFHKKKIEEGKVNKVNIAKLSTFPADKKYIVIKNESDNDIALFNDDNYEMSMYQDDYWIPSSEYRSYELKNVLNLDKFKVGNGKNNKSLEIGSVSDGFIYTFQYKNSEIELISVTPIDISIESKIWKMPLTHEPGKYLVSDSFGVRENPSDGYFFVGQISYDVYLSGKKSSAYNAEISPLGEVTDKIIPFAGSPNAVISSTFVEKNGKRLVAGTKLNSDDTMAPFIYGDYGCNFMYTPQIENFVQCFKIIHKDNNTYSMLYSTKDDDNYGFGIYEITIDSSNNVNGNVIFTCDTEDYYPQSFIHYNDEYIVMVQPGINASDRNNGRTDLIFIDDSNYLIKENKTKRLNKCLFNSFEKSDDEKCAFVSGSYIDALTYNDVAAFMKLDLETGEVSNNGNPYFPPSSEINTKLNSNYNCISIKDETVFLAGFIDMEFDLNKNYYKSGYPYIIAYDIKSEKQKWSKIYKDYKDYEINVCCLSEIGTPLIRMDNRAEKKSILASCGLLGDIPDRTLTALPRNPEIKNIENPDITIKLIDANGTEYPVNYKYESTINVHYDIIVPYNFYVPEGKRICGWKKNGESIDSFVVENYNEKLYAEYSFIKPEQIWVENITSNTITVKWTPVKGATKYKIKWNDEYDDEKAGMCIIEANSDCVFTIDSVLTEEDLEENLSPFRIYNIYVCALDESLNSGLFAGIDCVTDGELKVFDSNGDKYTIYIPQNIDKWTKIESNDEIIGYLPEQFFIPAGNKIIGWKKKNNDGIYEDVVFPYTVKKNNEEFFVEYKIAAPSKVWIDNIASRSFNVNWNSVFGASEYEIICSENIRFFDKKATQTFTDCPAVLKGPFADSDLTDFSPATKYYIKVQPKDSEGNKGEWSDVVECTTAFEVIVIDSEEIEHTISIPFSDSFSLSDIKNLFPQSFAVPHGYKLSKLQTKDESGIFSDVEFPYFPKENEKCFTYYSVFELASPNVTSSNESIIVSAAVPLDGENYYTHAIIKRNSGSEKFETIGTITGDDSTNEENIHLTENIYFSDYYADKNIDDYVYCIEFKRYDADLNEWKSVTTDVSETIKGNAWMGEQFTSNSIRSSYDSESGILTFEPRIQKPYTHPDLGNGIPALDIYEGMSVYNCKLEDTSKFCFIQDFEKVRIHVPYKIVYAPRYIKYFGGTKIETIIPCPEDYLYGDTENLIVPPVKVSFESNGGSYVETESLMPKVSIQTAPIPRKEGHFFLGWFKDSELTEEITFPYLPTESIKLYAKWKPVYSITFETNGGESVDTMYIDVGDVIGTEPVTSMDDGHFLGWYEDPHYEGEAVTFPYIPSANVTLYAKWALRPESPAISLAAPWVTSKRGGKFHTGDHEYTFHDVLSIISENENEYFSHYEIHATTYTPNAKSVQHTTTSKSFTIDIYLGEKTNHGSYEVTVYIVDIYGQKSLGTTLYQENFF